MSNKDKEKTNFKQLVSLFEQTQSAMQSKAARSVDIALVVRNWLFGWYIVEYQQNGLDRAEYGKKLLKKLSDTLTKKMGKGFSVDSLELMRKFYTGFSDVQKVITVDFLLLTKSETVSRISQPNSETVSRKSEMKGIIPDKIWQTLSAKFHLSWSHYVVLMTINEENERKFYEIEAKENAWGIRELKRQIN